jgi:hypothetical protein
LEEKNALGTEPKYLPFQAAFVVLCIFANIYFEWNINGLAAGVMASMLAWYLTRIFIYVRQKRGEGSRQEGQQ